MNMNFIAFSSQAKLLDHEVLDKDISERGSCGEACALERTDAPIGIGAQLGREGVQGLERALDRGAVGGGLRSQEANPRQRDIEGAKPPASPPVDELTRLGEERAGSRAITGGQLRVRERREEARLVPQRGASIASEHERLLEHARGSGEIAVRELRSAEKGRGLHAREQAAVLFRKLDATAAVGECAGQISPQAQHLAQECVRSVEGVEGGLALSTRSACRAASASVGRPRWALASAHHTRHKPGAVEHPTASRSPAARATSLRARSAVARAGARRPTASCAWASTERISNSNIASDPSASSVARSAHSRYCRTSPASPRRRP